MTATWAPLPWDSEFFGFRLGKIQLDGEDAASVAEAEAEARAAGVRCLYGYLDPKVTGASWLVQSLGYRFVESMTDFDLRPEEQRSSKPEWITIRPGNADDLPELTGMVEELAVWSRFAEDPRFGLDAARRMQAAWIERAATCETGEWNLDVAEDETGIIALVTRTSIPRPTIKTIATTVKGSGAVRHLIESARTLAGDQPLYAGSVGSRNVDSLRFLGRCGFRVNEVLYCYHRWLDEDARPSE